MAWAVDDFKLDLADLYPVAMSKPGVRHKGLGVGEADHVGPFGQSLEQEAVILTRPKNGHLKLIGQFHRSSTVIKMTVGEEDLADLGLVFPDLLQNQRQVATRIDDGGFTGLFADDQGAVLLIVRDRNNVDFQCFILNLEVNIMIAVIFELFCTESRADEYFTLAAALRSDLETIDGFISVERFESLTTKGKFLSLSFWRDEAALNAWRNLERHRLAQEAGRGGIMADYRLRVASVIRDYGKDERAQAPADSQLRHG